MRFGEVRSSAATELENFPEVEAFPQLSVTLPSGDRKVYEGQLQAAKLIEFLEGYAALLPEDESPEAEKGSSSSGKAAVPKALKTLEPESFKALVLEEELPVLVAFIGGTGEDSESDCSEQEARLQEVAAGSAGKVWPLCFPMRFRPLPSFSSPLP